MRWCSTGTGGRIAGWTTGAETNVPSWDGTRPIYDWAVAVLVSEAGGALAMQDENGQGHTRYRNPYWLLTCHGIF